MIEVEHQTSNPSADGLCRGFASFEASLASGTSGARLGSQTSMWKTSYPHPHVSHFRSAVTESPLLVATIDLVFVASGAVLRRIPRVYPYDYIDESRFLSTWGQSRIN